MLVSRGWLKTQSSHRAVTCLPVHYAQAASKSTCCYTSHYLRSWPGRTEPRPFPKGTIALWISWLSSKKKKKKEKDTASIYYRNKVGGKFGVRLLSRQDDGVQKAKSR